MQEKSTKGVIDLSIGNVGQGSGGSEPHRKKQFRKLLGDGEDSQAAALRYGSCLFMQLALCRKPRTTLKAVEDVILPYTREVHERFSWLQSKHIRDTDGRRPGHSVRLCLQSVFYPLLPCLACSQLSLLVDGIL